MAISELPKFEDIWTPICYEKEYLETMQDWEKAQKWARKLIAQMENNEFQIS